MNWTADAEAAKLAELLLKHFHLMSPSDKEKVRAALLRAFRKSFLVDPKATTS